MTTQDTATTGTQPAVPQAIHNAVCLLTLHAASLAESVSLNGTPRWGPMETGAKAAHDELLAAAQALLALPFGMPAGWKLVPLEPTREMIAKAQRHDTTSGQYRAMLAASPAAPASESVAEDDERLDHLIVGLATVFAEDYEGAGLKVDSVAAMSDFVKATGIRLPLLSAEESGVVVATWRVNERRSASIRFLDRGLHQFAFSTGQDRPWGTALAATAEPVTLSIKSVERANLSPMARDLLQRAVEAIPRDQMQPLTGQVGELPLVDRVIERIKAHAASYHVDATTGIESPSTAWMLDSLRRAFGAATSENERMRQALTWVADYIEAAPAELANARQWLDVARAALLQQPEETGNAA